MTREITEDYRELVAFLIGYNLAAFSDNAEYKECLKSQHKKYISLITLVFEIITQLKDGTKLGIDLDDSNVVYLKEVVSDIGNSIFCWANGAYKPSRMLLRSSIENIIRAIGSVSVPAIMIEKNMYKVFELADTVTYFKDQPISKDAYNRLHATYKTLCADVHTASVDNMSHLSSLNYFPHYETRIAKETSDQIIYLIKNMVNLLVVLYKTNYHLMHHRNQEIVRASLDVDVKRYLVGTD